MASSFGGSRPGAGRKRQDSVRLEFAIPRPLYEELTRCEKLTGVYRTRIAAAILCEGLIGGVVDRELRAASRARSSSGPRF
jgi:hypothetical protein